MVFGMNAWVLRAGALGGLAVVLRVGLGFATGYLPAFGLAWRGLCLAILLGAAFWWGLRDGQAKRRARSASSEVDEDLTMRWLLAGLAGGFGSGLVSWIVDWIPRVSLGDSGLLFEATAGASFIVLLIFIPGRLSGYFAGG